VNVRQAVRPRDGSPPFEEERTEGRLDEFLRRVVVEHGFGLVVVDPWAVFYAGAENSNDEVEAAVDQLRQLADDTGAAVVITHHLGKSQEGRDPEDLWRGASRLPDAASTRVTLLPRFTKKEAEEQHLAPDEARRHVSVRFLRREAPTPGFTAYLGHDGWWERLPDEPEGTPQRRRRLSPEDVRAAIDREGGRFGSVAHAARCLQVSREAAAALLELAVLDGVVREVHGTGGARAFVSARPTDTS
jgi:hypothetical protein